MLHLLPYTYSRLLENTYSKTRTRKHVLENTYSSTRTRPHILHLLELTYSGFEERVGVDE
jgi:hypothetical protein